MRFIDVVLKHKDNFDFDDDDDDNGVWSDMMWLWFLFTDVAVDLNALAPYSFV